MNDFSFLDDLLEDYRRRGYYPSAVCRVFDRERTLYCRAFGPAHADTRYDLASVTKIFTATMLFFLMEEGKIAEGDSALRGLPEAGPGPVTRARLGEVTLRGLLTHTSGILPWYPFYTDGRDFYTVLEKVLRENPPVRGMVYSDLNFMLIGRMVRHLSGLTLPGALERYIRGRLKIRSVSYGPVDPASAAPGSFGNIVEKRMCAERGLAFDGWRPDDTEIRGSCNDGNAFYYGHGISGHAGLFADAAALEKLCRFYLTADSPVFLRAMETDVCGRGLAFDKSDVFPEGCGHTGFTGTSLWLSRRHGIGAVILTNKYARPDHGAPGNSNEFRRAAHRGILARLEEAASGGGL